MGRYALERDTRRKKTDAERPDRIDRSRSRTRTLARAGRGEHRPPGGPGRPGEEGRRGGPRRPARQGHVRRLPGHLLGHQRAAAGGGGGRGGEVVAGGGTAADRIGGRSRREVGAARLRRRGGARVPPGRARLLRPGRPLVRRAHEPAVVKIRLLSVGRDKEFTAQGALEYADRVRRFAELDLVELPAASVPDAKEREAERILGKRLPRGELWALDERG